MPFQLKTKPKLILNQTGEEIRDALLALPDAGRRLVVTSPGSGEHRVVSLERQADGRIQIKYTDTPEA